MRPPLATTGGPTARADQHGIEGHGSGPKDVRYRTSRPIYGLEVALILVPAGTRGHCGTASSLLLDITRFSMQLCAGVVVYGDIDIQLMQHPDSAGSPDYSLLQLAPAPLGADADA